MANGGDSSAFQPLWPQPPRVPARVPFDDLLEGGSDPQDVHGVELSAGDLTKIIGLINESYDNGVITGFVTAFDAD